MRPIRRSAVTLIELMAVIAVLSILAAAVLPTFRDLLVERKSSVAALEVKAFLDAARSRAIANQRPVTVIFERLSSRWDGNVAATFPQSITAENDVSVGPNDLNYSQYNTSLRMVMAETLRPLEFIGTEVPVAFVPEVPAVDDNDGLAETGRVLSIDANDPRLSIYLAPGNDIEIVATNDQTFRFPITAVIPGNPFLVAIRNEGTREQPYGTVFDIERAALAQSFVRPFVFISEIASFRIYPQPRPIVSTLVEMPRGTCVDLSLSGLGQDDLSVNSTAAGNRNRYRDTRRMFASDWITLPETGFPATPQQLRPVQLTFSPTGSLMHIQSNGIGSSDLQRIEPHKDVFLFVGRTDQITYLGRPTNTIDGNEMTRLRLEELFVSGIKPNLLDPTGYWIRVSAASGAIAASPAANTPVSISNPDVLVGDLLTLSRQNATRGEMSAQ